MNLPPPLLAVIALATSIWFVARARRRTDSGFLVAVAATLAGLALAEAGAWLWFTNQAVEPPRSFGVSDPPTFSRIVEPAVLPVAPRLPGIRQARPRALFIGDSFTAGLGVPIVANFATLVGRATNVEVINHGLTGTDTQDQALLWHYYSSTWEPDVVVWVFVLNDLMPHIPWGGPDYLMTWDPGPVSGSYLLGLVQWVGVRRAVQAGTIEAYRNSLDPATNPKGFAHLESTLAEVYAAVSARGGRLVFVIFPLMWELERYPFSAEHDQVAAAAKHAGAEVIDLLPAFRNEQAPDLWVSKFDHHPNQRGHAIAARSLAELLRSRPLTAAPARGPAPTPAQWLSDARALGVPTGPNISGLRVALTLAAAAGVLAASEGGDENTAISEEAWSFARDCETLMGRGRWKGG